MSDPGLPQLVPVVAPKKGAKSALGSRIVSKITTKKIGFLSPFNIQAAQEQISNRRDKIQVALNGLAETAHSVAAEEGDAASLITLHKDLTSELTRIKSMQAEPEVILALLNDLKRRARTAGLQAVQDASELIERGQTEKRLAAEARENEQRAAEERARQMAARDKALERIAAARAKTDEVLLRLDGMIAQAPAETEVYASHCDGIRNTYQALLRDTDPLTAAAKWEALPSRCFGVMNYVTPIVACIEPRRNAKFYMDKLEALVEALPGDEALDETGRQRAAELRAAVEELGTKRVSAERSKGEHRATNLTAFCGKASHVYEKFKTQEMAAGLPSDASKRNDELDALVASLDGKEDLDSQIALRGAIALRFGVAFATSEEFNNPLGAGIKKLAELYKVMALVPPAHLKAKNGTMQLSYKEASPDTDDDGRPNKFALRDGPEGGGEKVSTIVLTLPTDGEKVKKKNARGEVEELDYFKATALHEIGHAVDDQEGFMVAHREGAEYGNWLTSSLEQTRDRHVSLLETTLSAVPKEELATFVTACLSDGKVPAKPTEDGPVLASWDALAAVGKMLAGLRQGAALWYKGGVAATAAAVDQRVYFEAYKDQWWSFALVARDASVAEYQWRAPGEWFAEAYSLYYLKKLPTTHPVFAYCEG
jgi:hypothetical protein